MSDSPESTLPILLSNNTTELVACLKAEYARADGFCKEVEDFIDEAGIPAMNELRYAGYHLLHSMNANGQISSITEMHRAIRHVQRATYEAAEAGIQIAIRQIDLFKTDYQKVTIGDVLKDWQDILTKRRYIEKLLRKPRELGDNRDLDHELHKKSFSELKEIVERLDPAREELNKKMAAERRLSLRFVVPICLAIISICIAVVVALTR